MRLEVKAVTLTSSEPVEQAKLSALQGGGGGEGGAGGSEGGAGAAEHHCV